MNYKGIKDKRRQCLNCNKEIEFKGYNYKYKYCDNKCQNEFNHKKKIKDWLDGKILGHYNDVNNSIASFVKKYLFDLHNEKCEKCGWSVINTFTNKIPLTVHHVDGNCTNSTIKNLQLLCPNCHSLTETYGAKNKGNSKRKYN